MENVPQGFCRCLLGDAITLKRGYDLPHDNRLPGDVPIVSSSGITGTHNEAKVEGPGVVTGRYGTLGEVFYVEQDFWPLNTALYVCEFKGNDPKYISYLLRTLQLGVQNAAGAVPGVNRNTLHQITILLADLDTQSRIADILSAYDDLIANNTRRMALLEKAMHLLYREWFVRLRFPGHEHTPIVNGVLAGWEKVTISEVCADIRYGYTASANQAEVGPKFLRITDIVPRVIEWADVPYCEIDEDEVDKYLLKEGDIVVARTGATTGYAKRLHKRHPEAIFASYLVRFRLRPDVDDTLVGIFIESDDYKRYIQNHMGGAAQPNANATILSSAQLLLPPRYIQDSFREQTLPMLDAREVLQAQNEKLKEARDLLLPRLMNGAIPL